MNSGNGAASLEAELRGAVSPVTLDAPSVRPLADPSEKRGGHRAGRGARDGGRSAVVIGAGLGGLSAAIHLARQGWRVDVLERNGRSGGRMDLIEEQGFRIDMGPSMLMMPEVLEKIFADCGRDLRDYLTLKRIDPAYRVCWPDGTCFEMGTTLEETVKSVRAFAPEDAAVFERFVGRMRGKYLNARHNFIERRFNSPRDMARWDTLRGFARALPLDSVWNFVAKNLRSEKLREAFTFQTLYLGISPFDCPSIYALLPYIEMEFGVWFPLGGMASIATALETLLGELGGEIHFHADVKRVLLDGGRAVGVETGDGRAWRSDVVVSNMDVPSTYKYLLPPAARRYNTDARLDSFSYGCSGYLLYLGTKALGGDLGHNAIVLSDDYRRTLDEICKEGKLPTDPAMHVCVPTRTDPSLAPPGHDVLYVLIPCPNTQANIDWDRELPLLRERALARLERSFFPGLRDKIVFEKVIGPPDYFPRYGCYNGAAYGGLNPTFLQSGYFRPRNQSEDVPGLYFAGASTHPGGGMPIVLTSGRLVAEQIALTHGA